MLAQVLERPAPVESRPLSLREWPLKEPGPGELRLRVEACAVCRTDLQLVEGDLPAHCLPVIPGHQAVGAVDSIGEGVEDWQVGDGAGVGWLGGTCGICEFCVSGRENLCRSAEFTGWDRNGGYAEAMLVRADFALRIPPGLPATQAAPLLCGGVIGYRSLLRSGIKPGGRLGLFGYGASARLAIQVARHWDCKVYVFTRSQAEQARALRDGSLWAASYDDAPPEPLDAAITFAPAGDVVKKALGYLNRGGVLAINAIHLDRLPEMDYDKLWWERELRSVANFTRQDAKEFLALAQTVPLATDVEVFPLARANAALFALKEGRLGGTAVLAME